MSIKGIAAKRRMVKVFGQSWNNEGSFLLHMCNASMEFSQHGRITNTCILHLIPIHGYYTHVSVAICKMFFLLLLHARCAVQAPHRQKWVGEQKSVGQPTFIFLPNCSQGLSAPVCFLGLAWPLPSFGCSPTCSVCPHRLCPDLPILLEPRLNRGQQHLSAHLLQ